MRSRRGDPGGGGMRARRQASEVGSDSSGAVLWRERGGEIRGGG